MEKQLFWYQGLFLQPQHLQLKDICDESLLTPYHIHIQPYLWGVGALEIKSSPLSAFSIQIDRGEFWFSDKAFTVLGENAVIEPRNFKDLWVEGGKPLTVYVGLKKISRYGGNVTTVTNGTTLSGVNTRYITNENGEEVDDLHQGGMPAQVKKLTYLLKIFFHTEKEALGGYELIPVARLERDGENIRASSSFVPPCFTIAGSRVLSGLIKEIYDQLAFRGHELENQKQKRGIHNAEFGSRDMVYLLALRSVNRYVPLFRHMLEQRHVHPWNLYAVMRQLIGELSSFSEKVNVLGEREGGGTGGLAYDHHDLWRCFSGAASLISGLLNEITSGPAYIVEFHYEAPYFQASFLPDHFEGSNQYYLVVRSSEEKGKVLDAVDIGVKLSSKRGLPVLIERSLPGVTFEYLPVPPQELPRRGDSTYFRIDSHGEQWVGVEQERSIAAYWDSPPENIKIEMMIVRRT